jgi:hypothetical protein
VAAVLEDVAQRLDLRKRRGDPDRAATYIAARFRGARERKCVHELLKERKRAQEEERSREWACVTISKSIRASLARKRVRKMQRQRDAMMVIMLSLRMWVLRRRQQRLMQEERQLRSARLIRNLAFACELTSEEPLTASPHWTSLRGHWLTLRSSSGQLAAMLRAAQTQELPTTADRAPSKKTTDGKLSRPEGLCLTSLTIELPEVEQVEVQAVALSEKRADVKCSRSKGLRFAPLTFAPTEVDQAEDQAVAL